MADTARARQLIVFSLHAEQYALPIASVREIIRYVEPQATATAADAIRGMINLRGRVLPVVDLSSRLGGVLEVTKATRILVIEIAAGPMGLIVDTVDGVESIADADTSALPAGLSGHGLGDRIAGVAGRLIVLVDPERALAGILPRPEPGPGSAPAPDEPEPGPGSAPASDEPEPPKPKGGWRMS
ncbi:MAG: chemotaxis protein CheW [Solirubrobacteraceae bacterium]